MRSCVYEDKKRYKQSAASSREIRKKHRLRKSLSSKLFIKTDVLKHSFLLKKLDRETITHLLLLSKQRIRARLRKGTSLLTAEGFASPCMVRAHMDPLLGSSRNCWVCYLLICMAAGARLHLKLGKCSSWLIKCSNRWDTFLEGSPARLTKEEELGSCF